MLRSDGAGRLPQQCITDVGGGVQGAADKALRRYGVELLKV
jgi:hypothetical protein